MNIFVFASISKAIYILFMISAQLVCTNMVLLPNIYGYITMSISILNLILKIIVFSSMICLMRRYSRQQYKINVRPTTIYFFIDLISYVTCIYYYTTERLQPRNEVEKNNHRDKKWYYFTTLIIYLLNIPQIMVGLSIIYLKDQKDMI